MAKNEKPANDKPTERQVKARVLVACALGAPNDVVEVDRAQADSLIGVLDTNPAAVAYAESLRR